MQRVLDILGAVLYTVGLPVCAFFALFAASELGPHTTPEGTFVTVLAALFGFGLVVSVLIGIVTVWVKIVFKRRFPWSQVLQLLPWLFLLALGIGYLVKHQ